MKRIAVSMMIGIMSFIAATAQPQFRTTELQRLATALSIDPHSVPDGYSHPLTNGLSLTIHAQEKTIDHIGLYLFSDQTRAAAHSPIIDFLERYFLQLKYPPVVKTASNIIRDDGFLFVKGSIATIDGIRHSDDFSYSSNNHRYVAQWSRNGEAFLAVSFPVEYELISGENKIEAENNLMTDIQKTLIVESKDDATRNDNYIDQCFSNRLYYQQGRLVASRQHPAETMANLMLSTNMQGHYRLNITQISYGFQKKVFQVPLQQWISFCRANGCQLFFGVDKVSSDGEVSGVVIAVNQAENYNHVLTVTLKTGCIHRREGVMNAFLYPYIPTHNVMNMFANFRKTNPKTFASQ